MKWVKKWEVNPFFQNIISILLSSAVGAGLGVIFWIVAARFYIKEDVGFATAILSSISLIVLISRIGLDQSLVRFFPTNDRSKIFSTALISTTIIAIIIGTIFIYGLPFWSPNLISIQSQPLDYIGLLLSTSIAAIVGSSFLGLRKAKFVLLQNLLNGSRILIIIPLVVFGVWGILASITLATFITIVFLLYALYKYFNIKIKRISFDFLIESSKYSLGNYISTLLISTPILVLPILLLNLIGPESSADFFIAYSVASLIFAIPAAISTSLFIEGCYGENIKEINRKSIKMSFIFLMPCVIFVLLWGDWLLSIFGSDYATTSFNLLKLFALSSFFYAIFQLYISINKIQQNVKAMMVVGGVASTFLLGLSYELTLMIGVAGVGYAWLLVFGSISIYILFDFRRKMLV